MPADTHKDRNPDRNQDRGKDAGKDSRDYDYAKQLTASSLQKLLETTDQLTHLSLPERTALIDEIARIIPAGNVPSLVAAGLANLPGRAVPIAESRRNLSLLMQGMQTFLDKAVYNTFFVGPATVLSGYQMLLKLAGKDLDESFPEGTWQFYVEFGLREDSARHTCETVGFQSTLERSQLKLNPADELAAWVTASAWLLDRYHVLLANEWIEHVRLHHLETTLNDKSVSRRWVKTRPYGTPGDSDADFTDYRRSVFESFCDDVLANINPRVRKRADESWAAQQAQNAGELAAYQRQMTILAALQPAEHNDSRTSLSRSRVCIAVIAGGRYYLVDIGGVVSVERLRPICAAILRDKASTPPASLDKALVSARRHDQPGLRKLLPDSTRAEIEQLRTAPIIVNWDVVPSDDLLADIRSGRRGIGDHALTIFRGSRSTVFDQSHIFFDGPWGMAVAEILTAQASRYARQLAKAPRLDKLPPLPEMRSLALDAPPGLVNQSRKFQLSPEVSGETTLVNVSLIEQIRTTLRKRNTDLRLTVNDLLLLHRALFNQVYQPSSALMEALAQLASNSDVRVSQVGLLAQNALEEMRRTNPALLIPMDASSISPRERIYPTTFRNPFVNLPKQHRAALAALDSMESAGVFGKVLASRAFEEARRDYFGTLQGFGRVVARYKDVSMKGESVSTATIKLLAGLPASVQRMLDSVPGTFDVLNDVIKGQEVFSNVGRVSASSSLTRFNTAKDDNEKKVLAWGIMTDAKGVMNISLRDARPHVAALINAKQQAIARQITQEFVDAYAITLNTFLEELIRIARARRQTE